jgi:hypothetical protein
MRKPLLHLIIAALAWIVFSNAAYAAKNLPYTTGFEEPIHKIGQPPSDGWISSEPTSAVVQGQIVHQGQAALEVLTGGTVKQTFILTGDDILWADGYKRGEGAEVVPDVFGMTDGSAVVSFNKTSGIMCFDGKGDGVGGAWARIGVLIDPSKWYRITLKLDFVTQTYDIYVDGVLRAQELGFLYSTHSGLSGFSATAGFASSFMDDIAIQQKTPDGIIVDPYPDMDADGKPDHCETYDYLTLVEGVMTNMVLADSDLDGLSDGEEAPGECVDSSPALALTNPRDRNTDDDAFSDGMEVLILATDPFDPTDPDPNEPGNFDNDEDDLPANLDSDENNPDVDDDGFRDGYETIVGSDPKDKTDFPSLGNANLDSVVNNLDAILLFNFALGNLTDVPGMTHCDINGDAIANNLDAVILFHWTFGSPEYLPM